MWGKNVNHCIRPFFDSQTMSETTTLLIHNGKEQIHSEAVDKFSHDH